MAFFDEMKGKLTQATQITAQKAKDLTEIARLNSSISDAEKQINELYAKLGFEIYRLHARDEEAECAELIGQINDLHARIEADRQQIDTINGEVVCPSCGAKVKQGAAFCASCGGKMPQVEGAPAAEQKPTFCSHCGAPLAPGAAFCGKCGGRVG